MKVKILHFLSNCMTRCSVINHSRNYGVNVAVVLYRNQSLLQPSLLFLGVVSGLADVPIPARSDLRSTRPRRRRRSLMLLTYRKYTMKPSWRWSVSSISGSKRNISREWGWWSCSNRWQQSSWEWDWLRRSDMVRKEGAGRGRKGRRMDGKRLTEEWLLHTLLLLVNILV